MRVVPSLFFIMAAQLLFLSSTDAQQILKTIRDYGLEKPLQFSPDDPWTRSEVFNLQAGYSGLFFNCDRQEDKRCSPYICWKDTCDLSIVPRRSIVGIWVKDWKNTRQRVLDGAGACCGQGCHCAKCKKQCRAGHAGRQSCQVTETKPQAHVEPRVATVDAMPASKSGVELRSTVQRTLETQRKKPPSRGGADVAAEPTRYNQAVAANTPQQKQNARRYGLISGQTLNYDLPVTTNEIENEETKSRFATALDLLKPKR